MYAVYLYVNINKQNMVYGTYFVVSFGFVTQCVSCSIERVILIIQTEGVCLAGSIPYCLSVCLYFCVIPIGVYALRGLFH